jgi:3-oxoacyl-[acyl-carrier protein] reductase
MEAIRITDLEGKAADRVGAYLFLASGVSSGYVTGQVIEVDSGQPMP